MATQSDVRKIALKMPGAREEAGRFAFHVEHKGKPRSFVWVWLERVDPKRARVPNPAVIAVRVRGDADKSTLIAAAPEKFFTEPHYHGFPAVLVRLRAVTVPELRALITEAWRCQAPPDLSARPPTDRRRAAPAPARSRRRPARRTPSRSRRPASPR